MIQEQVFSSIHHWRWQVLAGACLLTAGLGLLAVSLWSRTAPSPVLAPGRDYPGLFRFHVIADSDAPTDQQQKQVVRDALMPILQEATTGATSAKAVLQRLQTRQAEMQARAEVVLGEAGAAVPVRVEVGELPLDGREVGPLYLPAGTYPTLRVVLGRGAGQNWWCVLFPNLCFDGWVQRVDADPELLAQAEAALSRAITAGQPVILDERDLAELPVRPRLAVLRWLAALTTAE